MKLAWEMNGMNENSKTHYDKIGFYYIMLVLRELLQERCSSARKTLKSMASLFCIESSSVEKQ